jgi:hypothetical protein
MNVEKMFAHERPRHDESREPRLGQRALCFRFHEPSIHAQLLS